MPVPDPLTEAEATIDAAVRAHLDAEAARSDAPGMANRVLARLAAEPEPKPGPGRSWRRAASVAGPAALAAGVLIAVFAHSGPREAAASPAQVVQGARAAYSPNVARCYRVVIDSPSREAFPLLGQEAARTLCTRGDRFVVEPGFGGKGAWGSDGSGRVWVAPGGDGAAAFVESELPQVLRNAVKVHELETETLLDEVLAAFDLRWSHPPTRGGETYSVTATRRGEAQPLRLASAELVIDAHTRAVRTLALTRRTFAGGSATVTFTLLSTGPAEDVMFTPEGHLRPGAPVYDRTHRFLRHRLLRQHLGESIAAEP